MFRTEINGLVFTLDEGGAITVDHSAIDYPKIRAASPDQYAMFSLLRKVEELTFDLHRYKERMNWSELQEAFMQICKVSAGLFGSGKGSDGYLRIKYDNDNMDNDKNDKKKPNIYIEFGAYQIGNWNRHQEFGPYYSEIEAWQAAKGKVREAYDLINEELKEAGKQVVFYPSILL